MDPNANNGDRERAPVAPPWAAMPAGAGGPAGLGGPDPVPMDAAAMGRLLDDISSLRVTLQDQQARLNQQAEELVNTRETLQATKDELSVAQAAIQAAAPAEGMEVDQASSVAGQGQGRCRNNARLRPYGGETVVEPWCFYKRHFQAVAKFNRWSVEEASLMLVAAMRGEAQATAKAAETGGCKTLEDLLSAYDRVFLPPTLLATLRKAFSKIQQKEGESIRYLATRLQHSYESCWPEEDRRERDLIDQFVAALRDRKVARETDLKDPSNLQEAVNFALQAASWEERTNLDQEGILPMAALPFVDPRGAMQPNGAVPTPAGVNAMGPAPATVAPATTPFAGNRGGKGRGRGRGGNQGSRTYSFCGHCGSRQHGARECPNCWTCGSKDHFRGDCPKGRGNGKPNSRGRGRPQPGLQAMPGGSQEAGDAGQSPDFS